MLNPIRIEDNYLGDPSLITSPVLLLQPVRVKTQVETKAPLDVSFNNQPNDALP